TVSPAVPWGVGERLIPAPVLFVGVSGIVYGSLVALWVVGLVSGRGNLSPELPPATGQTIPVVAVLVVGAVLYFFLQVALVAISAACLRLRPLARRLMVVYAVTDLVLQLAVLVLALTWVEPARVRALAAAGAGGGGGAPTSGLWTWVVQWTLLSAFPLVAIYVLRRHDGRSTFQ